MLIDIRNKILLGMAHGVGLLIGFGFSFYVGVSLAMAVRALTGG